ncbi:MAG TPA: hypothetical protein VL361_04140 [Candidatus Limnocylindrales bacterium]|nr:hypothetical protein [Candidatus Limnocylindrales bacterium]
MSLLRLLTAGKSLVGLKNPARRYILSARGALPKFNSKKNPFRTTTHFERVTSAQDPLVASACTTQATASTSIGSPASEQGSVSPAAGDADGACVTQPLHPRNRVPQLGSIFSWLRPKVAVNPTNPRLAKSMVQCELSLDTVRVVRNDLSDSDFEIVPTKVRPAKPEPELPRPAVEQTVSPESAWNRVTRQFFGAGKS